MSTLKSLGTAQTRKIYGNHGLKGDIFGVSWANLGKLKKQLKTDHDLAMKLWKSGNFDARILATMIMDPAQLASSEIDAMIKDLDNYAITDAFTGVVKQTPFIMKKMEKWTKHKSEWLSSAGWNLMTNLAMENPDLDDAFFESQLERIESSIHASPNRTKYSMNNTVISIGCRNKKLEKKAIAAAKRIGLVEVDHGKTGCKTPDAESYIKKTMAYRAAKAKKKKTTKKKVATKVKV
ncbi:MAG: DNA alkylation repair protein [Planctomycetota bacterium]|nr:DNA alkylation repair protein [Planctomycetota bacterium]